MFSNLRSRIALANAVLAVLCVGALTIYLVSVGQTTYLTTLEEGVQAQARLVGAAARPALQSTSAGGDLDALAKRLGAEAGVRITIVDRAGTVLGDSEQDPSIMENHSGRPEVAAALHGSQAESRRVSSTVGYGTLYVAVPISDGTQMLGAARVAVPLAQVEAASREIATAIAVGGLASILLVLALSLLDRQEHRRPRQRSDGCCGPHGRGRSRQASEVVQSR